MLDGVVGGENDQSYLGPRGDAAVDFEGQMLKQNHLIERLSNKVGGSHRGLLLEFTSRKRVGA
jgi:hypothetical protein